MLRVLNTSVLFPSLYGTKPLNKVNVFPQSHKDSLIFFRSNSFTCNTS